MRRSLLFFVCGATLALACGTKGTGFDSEGGAGDDASLFDDSSLSSDGGQNVDSLTVLPKDPVLVYSGSPVTQQFQALDGQMKPVTPDWSLDNVAIGTIDKNGLFAASGAAGGTGTVTATLGKMLGSTTVTVQLQISENPGNVPANVITQLKAGGNADAQFKWLYPYDKTVFPRGLTGPTLQLAGQAITWAWVHVESASKSITYDGYFGASSPGRIDLPAATWTTITQTGTSKDPMTISVTKMSGAAVTGPIKETWTIAPGSLKGTVYYNSYNSQLANNIGAVLKLKPGGTAQILSGGNGKCTVCHTVSADGNVMYASNNSYSTGAKYDLKNNAQMSNQRTDYVYNFPAVYPDGSLTLSTAGDKIGGMWGQAPSLLYDAQGAQVAATGWTVQHAAMPAFSPDGKRLAFNDEDMGNTLAVMDFAVMTKTFSNLKSLATDQPSNLLGWPSFTPDSNFVIYDNHLGTSTVGSQPNYGTWGNQRATLKMVDASTKTIYPLQLLNGYNGNTLYLPFGTDDENRDFEPNVLPLAVGGYYWVAFTSRRQYGNTINTVETGTYGDTTRKKIWVAAIDMTPTPNTDPSHPAFYLPGQELASGNMRAFWALDPCKQDGNTCLSGDECCNGYCRQVNEADGAVARVCVPPPGGCSNEFEKCTTAGDCCAPGSQCINGHCALPPPI